jgi:hypothetical protein
MSDSEQYREELQRLFYERLYSRGDVLLATEVSEKALEHMTKPGGPLRFVGATQGRPMKYRGHDILMIEVVRRLSLFGISHYGSHLAREAVSDRLNWGLAGLVPGNAEAALILYPYRTQDDPNRTQWACIKHIEGQPEPWMPPAALIVNIDRLIEETIAKLRALRDDTEMPRFHPLVEAAREQARQAAASSAPGATPQRDFLNVTTDTELERPRDPAASSRPSTA